MTSAAPKARTRLCLHPFHRGEVLLWGLNRCSLRETQQPVPSLPREAGRSKPAPARAQQYLRGGWQHPTAAMAALATSGQSGSPARPAPSSASAAAGRVSSISSVTPIQAAAAGAPPPPLCLPNQPNFPPAGPAPPAYRTLPGSSFAPSLPN